jgi:hypothetical protein
MHLPYELLLSLPLLVQRDNSINSMLGQSCSCSTQK